MRNATFVRFWHKDFAKPHTSRITRITYTYTLFTRTYRVDLTCLNNVYYMKSLIIRVENPRGITLKPGEPVGKSLKFSHGVSGVVFFIPNPSKNESIFLIFFVSHPNTQRKAYTYYMLYSYVIILIGSHILLSSDILYGNPIFIDYNIYWYCTTHKYSSSILCIVCAILHAFFIITIYCNVDCTTATI